MRSEDVDVERQRRRCQARRNLAVKKRSQQNRSEFLFEESLFGQCVVVFLLYVCCCRCFSVFFWRGSHIQKGNWHFFDDKVDKAWDFGRSKPWEVEGMKLCLFFVWKRCAYLLGLSITKHFRYLKWRVNPPPNSLQVPEILGESRSLIGL